MNRSNPTVLAQEYSRILRDKIGPHLSKVYLFGSQARGDSWEGSDYDMLVIVDKRIPFIREKVLEVAEVMMNKHEKLFSTLIYSEEEWEKAQGFPLAWNIKHEGIPV